MFEEVKCIDCGNEDTQIIDTEEYFDLNNGNGYLVQFLWCPKCNSNHRRVIFFDITDIKED